jgi:hypothetical protein
LPRRRCSGSGSDTSSTGRCSRRWSDGTRVCPVLGSVRPSSMPPRAPELACQPAGSAATGSECPACRVGRRARRVVGRCPAVLGPVRAERAHPHQARQHHAGQHQRVPATRTCRGRPAGAVWPPSEPRWRAGRAVAGDIGRRPLGRRTAPYPRSPPPASGTISAMPDARRREAPDRNLALELVRVTEAGAMAAGRWVGRGDKEAVTAPPSTPCASWSTRSPCAASW